ncbi:Protein yellow [Orchesella cincta]|uniref:Protein yellow n=1 Tax=Orchesella cincta TaxID=48709 RepID=A0A1D2M325_ORCCI|nr:Protein yellow [Orchesella cincta]
MNQIGNCSALQLVQFVEIDEYNRMWIVDVGRLEIFTDTPRNLCPAKIVVVDLMNGNRMERVYEFPHSIVPRDSNAIRDTQIAFTSRYDCFAYISNINPTQTSGLIIYDFKNNDAWTAVHPSMFVDPDKQNITIEGTILVAPFGITGLGLSPRSTQFSTLYFSKVAGDRLYRVNTNILKNKEKLKQNPMLSHPTLKILV